MRLPSSVGTFAAGTGRSIVGDAAWSVAYGLCRWGYATEQKDRERGVSYITESLREFFKKMFRSFLP